MSDFYQSIVKIFEQIIQYSTLILECVGVAVLLFSAGKALVMLFCRKGNVRLTFAEGIALSLEFKLGGELLRTVMVESWEELLTIGGIILLRAAMTFLIQWEIRIEKRDEEQKKELESTEHHTEEEKNKDKKD